jgi:uncharacterized membrane protein YfcA
MTLEISIIVLAAFIGAFVQTIVGFGILLFLTPILLVFLSPPTAIMSAFVAGTLMAGLTLFTEKRKTEIVSNYLIYLILVSSPAVLIGTYILAHTQKAYLLIIVGITVITGLLIQHLSFSEPHPKYRSGKWTALTCFVAGVFNGSTSMSGPPLALWLRSFSTNIHEIRDTFAVSFLYLNILSFISINIAKPSSITKQSLIIMALLVPVILAGHKIGTKVLRKININHFRIVFSFAILTTGIISLVTGISNL